jgi:branched-subunit amino acid transport protein
MTGPWFIVLMVGLSTAAIKAAGPVALGGHDLPDPVGRVVALMAPPLLAALIATQIFTSGHSLTLDSRAIGLGTGALAIALRVPTLLVVVLAALATALARAFL